MMPVSIAVRLPDGSQRSMALPGASPQLDAVESAGRISFAVPHGRHAYLSSKPDLKFQNQPSNDPFGLRPDTAYDVSGDVELDGGEATLWLIEYSRQSRRGHVAHPLKPGPFKLTWRTHAEYHATCLAIRLVGTGSLRIENLTISLRMNSATRNVEAGGAALLPQDPFTNWQPSPVAVERPGDAHLFAGLCRCDDPRCPDIDSAAFRQMLDRCGIERCLVTPYGPDRRRDTFDQICELARELPGRLFPLLRLRSAPETVREDRTFQVRQLELLWQTGRLSGLAIDRTPDGTPDESILDWLQRRQVLTLWHIRDAADLAWLERNALKRYTFPVLLSHSGDHRPDRARDEACLALLGQYTQLYLVTGSFSCNDDLARAIRAHPDHVILGSADPRSDPAAARAVIERLNIPTDSRTQVIAKNLRILTERVEWQRNRLLEAGRDLLFRPLPQTADDVQAAGFEIVPPESFSHDEFQQAKTFWQTLTAEAWYEQYKPWARLLIDLVRDLNARSVLEFGCNMGRNLRWIAQACPDVRLVGLDVNHEAIRLGREATGLDLREGDETGLREFAAGEFDLVFTVSVLDHISDISGVCAELLRVSARNLFCLEVTLPVEGRVVRHLDHARGGVRESTGASYSWNVRRFIEGRPRVWRLDCHPCYLHPAALGPYYWSYLAFLEPPEADEHHLRRSGGAG